MAISVSQAPPSMDFSKTLTSFTYFRSLPPEIRCMVWTEFYLEPRKFDLREGSSSTAVDRWSFVSWRDGTHMRNRRSSWTLHVHESSRRYYELIDTAINHESAFVAQRIRPKTQISESFSTDIDNDSEESDDCPPRIHFRISWSVDYIVLCLKKELCGCPPSMPTWFRKIQILVLHGHGGYLGSRTCITSENQWLLSSRTYLTDLTRILRVSSTMADGFPFNDAAYFQTKYILREASGISGGWRNITCEKMSYSKGLSWSTTPRQPGWTEFIDKLRLRSRWIREDETSLEEVDKMSELGEVEGSKQYFKRLQLEGL
ncbi:hypothetical protein GQ607_013425 [Colletotrichum asianum]|uniref:2EXR domain-containing protein n=1 Tax=Colletotrichum asianum TaxID=702518 RepID=A0A8H3W3Q5_9PEZI|nr:hypothetical protein GQ607_013425 [Colletotrichum asianum]